MPFFQNNTVKNILKISIFLVLAGFGLLLRFNALDELRLTANEKVSLKQITHPNHEDIAIGAKIDEIYMFSDATKTFNASGTIWLTWSEQTQKILVANNGKIENWLNFVNLINNWDSRVIPFYENPIKNSEGHYMQALKFAGQFYVDNINFHRYPFHTIKLPIILEVIDYSNYSIGTNHDIRLFPDKKLSGTGSFIEISGYIATGFNIYLNQHEFDNISNTYPITNIIDQVVFETEYKKSTTASIVVHFIPLLIVMSLVIISPMLSSSLWDFRLSIPPTALLTLVFLQQGAKDKLPDIPYVMYMDTVYNICYISVALLFCFFVWSSNKIHAADENDRNMIIEEIDIKNRKLAVMMPIAIIGICLLNWLLLSMRYPA